MPIWEIRVQLGFPRAVLAVPERFPVAFVPPGVHRQNGEGKGFGATALHRESSEMPHLTPPHIPVKRLRLQSVCQSFKANSHDENRPALSRVLSVQSAGTLKTDS